MKHILIVDDNAANLKYAENIFSPFYSVTCLLSGSLALKYLQKFSTDLILLDINMPEMDGFEVVRLIKSNACIPDIPIIFLTSQSDPETEGNALSIGVVDFIAKPVVAKTALSRIKLHLELTGYRKNLEDIVRQKTEMIDSLQGLLTDSISDLVEHRDGNTGGHIKRLREYVSILIDKLNEKKLKGYEVDGQYKVNILRATPLHDIGKIRIRDDVLLKPAKLTTDEMEHMKMHVVWGSQIIDDIVSKIGADGFMCTARNITRYHHERWNGAGYPEQLAGENIPLCARIMSIPDVYDALVTERPYKNAFTHDKAVEIIVGERGKSFDPVLTDVFGDVCDKFDEIRSL